MPQVPTQVIANWVEKWSFDSMGEDGAEDAYYMHYKREINYHEYKHCYNSLSTEMFNFYVLQDK